MTIKFKRWLCELNFESYEDDKTALTLTERNSGEIIAVCTVNLPDLKIDEIAIKDYSENRSMYQTLLGYKIITPDHRFTSSGFINNIPVVRLNWKAETYD